MTVSAANSQIFCREIYKKEQNHNFSSSRCCLVPVISGAGFWCSDGSVKKYNEKKLSRDVKVEAFWQETAKPIVVELVPVADMDQLDQVLKEAQELSQPIIIDWMAAWCRKCIYLKPKLEKLAAEYNTRIKFYYVDVNNVSQTLVKRGNITKMPTIQLWKDGEMKEEVIGGHKAWLVIDEVREMIQKYL